MIQPSISVHITKNVPQVLWICEDKMKDGDTIDINKGYQIMVTIDVFSATETWPFAINITMPYDQVALGTCSFEFKPLIASALAMCGCSPYISVQGSFRNHAKEEIATIAFDARVIYYPGSEHIDTVETIVTQSISENPPHDNFYQFRPESRSQSSSYDQSSSSHMAIETETESSDEVLGSHNNYHQASEANQQKLNASRSNLDHQLSSIGRRMSMPGVDNRSSILDQPRVSIISGQTSALNISASRPVSNIGRSSTIPNDFDSDTDSVI